MNSRIGLLLLVALSRTSAVGQGTPTLRFDPPTGFTGGGGDRRYAYVSINVDANVEVYPFQPLPAGAGDFRQTLLRDLVVPENREQRYFALPQFQSVTVPEADSVVAAR